MSDAAWHVTGAAMRDGLAAAADPFFTGMTRGTMRLLLFAPQGVDAQRPHTQDELYVIARGTGWFARGGERVSFAAGDALFVPAGMDHRFEQTSDDFETWDVFWGPKGGEENTLAPRPDRQRGGSKIAAGAGRSVCTSSTRSVISPPCRPSPWRPTVAVHTPSKVR